jgi:hypothetical protein
MPAVGFRTWFEKQCPTVFVVKNIAPNRKRIRIFSYPIKNGFERDLMAIPEVSEADIRHSLLKGELLIKLIADEIVVTDSNINLLQFDECHKAFLKSKGVPLGTEITADDVVGLDDRIRDIAGDGYGLTELPFLFKQRVDLLGIKDGANRIFTVPAPDKFIQGSFSNNEFRILVTHNGRDLVEGVDYIVSESGGTGTGFDTIVFTAFAPESDSCIQADYVTENI